MRLLLDTSVLVASLIPIHEFHERALPWFQRVIRKQDAGVIAVHSIAELYSAITGMPRRLGVAPQDALVLIMHNIVENFEIVSLTAEDYLNVVKHLADSEVFGGATYDALIAHSAIKAGVDRIITLNTRDFPRVYPQLAEKVIIP